MTDVRQGILETGAVGLLLAVSAWLVGSLGTPGLLLVGLAGVVAFGVLAARRGPIETLQEGDELLQRVETVLIIASTLGMVLLAFYNIASRNLPDLIRDGLGVGPVPWFDVAARYLVLWVGLLGASLAAARNKHISIELATKFASPVGKRAVEVLTNFCAFVVVLVLTVAAADYVFGVVRASHLDQIANPDRQAAYALEAPALGLQLPEWVALLVMPVGFALIAFHFFVHVNVGLFGTEPLADQEEAIRREIEEFDTSHPEESGRFRAIKEKEAEEEARETEEVEEEGKEKEEEGREEEKEEEGGDEEA